jgi:zinc protease
MTSWLLNTACAWRIKAATITAAPFLQFLPMPFQVHVYQGVAMSLRIFRPRFAKLMFACLALTASVSAQNFQVQEHMLKNGMKVLVQEDSSIPNVALYIFFRVGSRNEHAGTTGISHFFEHMMFNGAKKYGPGEFDHAMEAQGGANNASTSNDLTIYQDWFPSSALELIFDLEADRIQNLAFDPKIVDSERQVVYSERRLRTEDSNQGLLNEQVYAAAFTAHPYHWPVVGWPSDIEKWSMDDLKSYFSSGYSPSNATMVVVGNVKADEVFRLAQKYIEPIPPRNPPPPVRTVEPKQLGERRVWVHKVAQLPLLNVAYHVPDAKSPDYYALDLVDTVLTAGESSRLYRALVDQQLAVEIQSGNPTNLDPELFGISVQPRQGVTTDKVEQVLYAEIDRLKETPLDEHELAKIKNQAIARYYRSLRSINGRANAIGTYEIFFGDYHKLAQVEQEYMKVTASDIQRVVKQYFDINNRTVGILIPDSAPAGEASTEEKQ